MSLCVVVHHSAVIKGAGGVYLSSAVISFDSGSSVKASWITPQRLNRAQSKGMHAYKRTSKPQSPPRVTGFTTLGAVIRGVSLPQGQCG